MQNFLGQIFIDGELASYQKSESDGYDGHRQVQFVRICQDDARLASKAILVQLGN